MNRIAKDLNGVYIRGIRPGGLGILKRNETDVSSTGAIPFRCRLDEFDFLHTRLMFKADLFYRLTPDLTQSSGKITFLVPFNELVWMALATLMVLLIVFFRIIFWKQHSDSSVLTQVIGIFSNQGLETGVRTIGARTTAIMALVLAIVVSNYYSSQLLNVILTAPSDRIKSTNDLISTGIRTCSSSTFGIRLALKDVYNQSGRNYEEVFYEVAPPSAKNQRVVVFYDHAKGLDYMKQGSIAYTGESTSLQGYMRKKMSPVEICETRKQPLLNAPQYHVLRKRSQYTQAFMIGLLKADEAGLLQRTKNQFYNEMPPCTVGVKLYSVPFLKVKGAFMVLWGKKN